MATFNFQVDRVHKVTKPLPVHPDVGLMSEPRTLEAGTAVVYRGLVQLGGTDRHVFDVQGGEERQRVYTRDRAALETSLEEDYGALIRP